MVWQVGEAEGFVPETRAMRNRVVSLIAAKKQRREIKLGAGAEGRRIRTTVAVGTRVRRVAEEPRHLAGPACPCCGRVYSRGALNALRSAYRLARYGASRADVPAATTHFPPRR